MSFSHKTIDEMGANKASTTSNKNSHSFSKLLELQTGKTGWRDSPFKAAVNDFSIPCQKRTQKRCRYTERGLGKTT